MNTRTLALSLSLHLLFCLRAPAPTYNVQIRGGADFNLVGSQFASESLTTYSSFLTGTPSGPGDGDQAIFWDVGSQDFNPTIPTWSSFNHQWSPDAQLPLGTAFFYVNNNADRTLTRTTAGTPSPIPALLPNTYYALSSQEPKIANYQDLVGDPTAVPNNNTYVLRWDVAIQDFGQIYHYEANAWQPFAPAIPLGEGAFVAWFPPGLPAPNIVSAQLDGCDGIVVKFDRDLDPVNSAVAGNFTLSGGIATISAAVPQYSSLPSIHSIRSVRLQATGLSSGALLTIHAPGVTGIGGTPVNPASSAQVQASLVGVSASMDCGSSVLCLTFDQDVADAGAVYIPNYSVQWADIANSLSGSLSILGVTHSSPNVVCLQLSTPPAGDLLFTVSLNSATATPLVSTCGTPLAVTPIFNVSTKCTPVVLGRIFRHQSAPPCVQDMGTSMYGSIPNEYGLVNWSVKLDDGVNSYYGVSDVNGDFQIRAPVGSYTLTINNPPAGWTERCPTGGGGIPITLTPGGVSSGNIFAMELTTPDNDLSVNLHANFGLFNGGLHYSTPCCGQPMNLIAFYSNDGNEAIFGATVQIILPPTSLAVLASTAASSPSVGAPTLSGGILTWTIPVLLPGQSGTVQATINLTCAAGSLQTVSAAAAITTPPGDPTPANNISFYSDQTSCSYDPNDKTVSPHGCGPQGFVPVGTEFEYLIQFQNTGNGPAYQVVLRDFLDPGLDLSTLQLLGGSHPYAWSVNAATREIVWRMDNINLPGASYDEPDSHGFVRYKIHHNAGAPVGTVITNQCAIYFDANAPVLTAITTNTLSSSPAPVAAFTTSASAAPAGQAIDFKYTGGTTGATFAWDFGPGAIPRTSTEQNPSGVIYTTAGAKLPALTVSLGGCSGNRALALLSISTPAPAPLEVQRTGAKVILSWTNAAFHLQAAPALSAPSAWTNVPGASPCMLTIGPGPLFFRLVYP